MPRHEFLSGSLQVEVQLLFVPPGFSQSLHCGDEDSEIMVEFAELYVGCRLHELANIVNLTRRAESFPNLFDLFHRCI